MGNIKHKEILTGENSYGYDALYQLTNFKDFKDRTTTYGYDYAGNKEELKCDDSVYNDTKNGMDEINMRAKRVLLTVFVVFAFAPVFYAWNTDRGGNERQGYYENGSYLPSTITKIATINTSKAAFNRSQPIIDGYIYTGTADGYIHKIQFDINAGTATVVASFRTDGAVYATPLLLNGVVYTGSMDGYMYALNNSDMTLTWKRQASAGISASAVSVGQDTTNSTIVFADNNGTVNIYSQGGVLQATKKLDDYFISAPAYTESIIAVTASGMIYKLDSNAAMNSFFTLDAESVSSPISKNVTSYLASDISGKVYLYTTAGKAAEFSAGGTVIGPLTYDPVRDEVWFASYKFKDYKYLLNGNLQPVVSPTKVAIPSMMGAVGDRGTLIGGFAADNLAGTTELSIMDKNNNCDPVQKIQLPDRVNAPPAYGQNMVINGSSGNTYIYSVQPLPTPTYVLDIAWPQKGHDSENRSMAPLVGHATASEERYSYLVTGEIGTITADNNKNIYFSVNNGLSNYIYKVDDTGTAAFVEVAGTRAWGVTLGRNNHLYFSFVEEDYSQQPPYFGLRAIDILDGRTHWTGDYVPWYDWRTSQTISVDSAKIGYDGKIYLPTRERGLRKIQDMGNSYYDIWEWSGKMVGRPLCFQHSGAYSVIDGNGYSYFPEPMTQCMNNGEYGLSILRYDTDGNQIGKIDIGMNYNYELTRLILDTPRNRLFVHTIETITGESVYLVLNGDFSGGVLDTVHTKYISSGANTPLGALNPATGELTFIGNITAEQLEGIVGCQGAPAYSTLHEGNDMHGLFGYFYQSGGGAIKLKYFTGFAPCNEQPAVIANITTDIVVDEMGKTYFGTYDEFFVLTSNMAVSRSMRKGIKKNIALGVDNRTYYTSGNNIVCVAPGGSVVYAPQTKPKKLSSSQINATINMQTITFTLPSGKLKNIYMKYNPYVLINQAGPIAGDTYVIDASGLTAGATYSFIVTEVDEYGQESEPSDPIYIVFGTPTSTPTETSTDTYTYTETPTITETSTETVTNTITETPTMTATQTPTMAVVLKYKSGDTGAGTTSPHMFYRVTNNDSRALDLARLEIRYWYSFDGVPVSEQLTVDYAGKLPAGINLTNMANINIINGAYSGGQDRYVRVKFGTDAGQLVTDEYLEINARFNRADWGAYDQSNDWSFGVFVDYMEWNRVGVYYDGVLIWGLEPQDPTVTATPTASGTRTETMTASFTPTVTETLTSTFTVTETETTTDTPTASLTVTATVTPTVTPTDTIEETMTVTEVETLTHTTEATQTCTNTVVPTMTWTATPAEINIALEYRTTEGNTFTNSPHPVFRLINNGVLPLDLARVEIRYYYQYEGTIQQEQAWVDYAGRYPSGVNITGDLNPAIIAGSYGGGQDRYLKVAFNSGAGSIGSSEYADLQMRFNKTDWNSYDQSNDYSFMNYGNFTAMDKVVVYVDGVKAWGTLPGLGALSLKNIKPPVAKYVFDEAGVYNYPNPFNGNTTIRFELESPEAVLIKVYDMNNVIVWEKGISAENTMTGINSVVWDGRNSRGLKSAAGMYLLEVSTQEKSVIKKIAVVK